MDTRLPGTITLPLYTWDQRCLDVVMMHSPRLKLLLHRESVTLVERRWVNCPHPDFLEGREPGLVSLSRSHWSHAPVWSAHDWDRWRQNSQNVPPRALNTIAIHNVAFVCRQVGHIGFSRDQLLRTIPNSAFGDFHALEHEVICFINRVRGTTHPRAQEREETAHGSRKQAV